ncbi:MAG: hypothetical protein SPI61_00400 [Ezakiella sp.]|uniref:hypothetical protein n=1 Tax=Ezakiella sp. TaxID=1935205 RepID=UPI0029768F34|nr:hypothetical protein [Ezakiella sp.]MDD7730968.1 hypothetical protein [Eubacteriales bacterium]MDY6079189.1 hypothetical protein [Ezakiella sp.]
MIDREFIKKLNGIGGVLVTYEEKQTEIDSNGEIISKNGYKIRYKNPDGYYGKAFLDIVEIDLTDGYARADILKDITQIPIHKIIDVLKVVDEKVEAVNRERGKQCETH